jgi:hypothetical protein
MRGNRLLALLAVVLTTAACAHTTPPPSRPATATGPGWFDVGVPGYPVGEELPPGIEVLDSIPVEELTTSGTTGLDENDPCAGISPEVVAPARVDPASARNGNGVCFWRGDLTMSISSIPTTTMAKNVERHRLYADSGEDILAHLAWLRIDGHYALERIWACRPGAACWLSLDVGAPKVVNVLTYRHDRRGKPVPEELPNALDDYCPAARLVAQNLLRHLFRPVGATSVVTGPTK